VKTSPGKRSSSPFRLKCRGGFPTSALGIETDDLPPPIAAATRASLSTSKGVIQESVRAMSAEERASLQGAMRPPPPAVWHSDSSRETWMLAAVWVLTLVVIAGTGGTNTGGFVVAAVAGALFIGYRFAAEAVRKARRREFRQAHTARMSSELSRALEDGRVMVKRVRAVAVVEIEPLEDEGTGYVFDLGDGRVLFLKGDDYFPAEEGATWPNTDFEIVRTAAGGMILDLHCHGTALPPLRIIPRDEVDPEKGWDEREEVLEMSVDDAVRTVLREG
jgi:hypothetical protein